MSFILNNDHLYNPYVTWISTASNENKSAEKFNSFL